jgi:hypothetical protein
MMPFESSQSMKQLCLIKLNECLKRSLGRICPRPMQYFGPGKVFPATLYIFQHVGGQQTGMVLAMGQV